MLAEFERAALTYSDFSGPNAVTGVSGSSPGCWRQGLLR
jgi:hypothetical protein